MTDVEKMAEEIRLMTGCSGPMYPRRSCRWLIDGMARLEAQERARKEWVASKSIPPVVRVPRTIRAVSKSQWLKCL